MSFGHTKMYILCTSVAGCPKYVRKCTSEHGRTVVVVQTWHWTFGRFSDVSRTSVVAWAIIASRLCSQHIFFSQVFLQCISMEMWWRCCNVESKEITVHYCLQILPTLLHACLVFVWHFKNFKLVPVAIFYSFLSSSRNDASILHHTLSVDSSAIISFSLCMLQHSLISLTISWETCIMCLWCYLETFVSYVLQYTNITED